MRVSGQAPGKDAAVPVVAAAAAGEAVDTPHSDRVPSSEVTKIMGFLRDQANVVGRDGKPMFKFPTGDPLKKLRGRVKSALHRALQQGRRVVDLEHFTMPPSLLVLLRSQRTNHVASTLVKFVDDVVDNLFSLAKYEPDQSVVRAAFSRRLEELSPVLANAFPVSSSVFFVPFQRQRDQGKDADALKQRGICLAVHFVRV